MSLDEQQTLESATETGQPIRRRLSTPAAVRTVLQKMDDADWNDAYRRAVIQGMIDGNPPYEQSTLDDAGLGTMTNVNFMSLSANLNGRVNSAHELLAEVPTIVEVAPAAPDPEDKMQGAKCGVIQEEFSRMLLEWAGYLPLVDLVVRECDAYGLGPLMFRDEYDWRPHAFKRGNLRVEPRAKVVVDDNDLLVIRDEMSAGELFKILDDEDAARLAGWKVSYLKDLLTRVFGKKEGATDTQDAYQRSTWESIQQAFKNNDPEVQAKEFDKVPIRHVLVKEVYGKQGVTHLIIPEKKDFDFFLYEKEQRFERMSQVMWWLPANYGDGYLKSIRGVASWMAKHDDLSNRFLCKTFDAGFLTAGMVVQPSTAADLGKLQFIQHGPWTILPPELNAVQSTFMPQVAQLIQLREVSESIMKNNTGTYRRYDEDTTRNADRKTARQVVEETSKEQRYEKAEIAFRYQHFDQLYTEVFRRATNREYVESKVALPGVEYVKKFFDRCEKRGIKRSDLLGKADRYVVSATRAIGLGSLGVKYDLSNQVLGVRFMLDDVGQRMALRDWLAVRVGQRNVDRYAPPVSRDMVPSNEMSHAVLENNDLAQGQQVQVGTDQLHRVHIQVHLQGAVQPIVQAAVEDSLSDPARALAILSVAIPHIMAHLQIVAQDQLQADFVKGVQQFLATAEKLQKQLEGVVQRQQAEIMRQRQKQEETVAEAEQTLKDRELEAKVYEINRKYELKRMEQASRDDSRRERNESQADLDTRRMERDEARRDAQALADIRRKDTQAQAQQERER